MRNLKTIGQLFEADLEKGQDIRLVGPGKSDPDSKIRFQWEYDYVWPSDKLQLDSFSEVVKVLGSSDKKDIKAVISSIASVGDDHVVGISKNSKSIVNNRFLAKNLQQKAGLIFVFNPDIIDETKIPSNKKLTSIEGTGNKVTFIVDQDIQKYYKTSSTGPTSKTDQTKKDPIQLGALIQQGSEYYDWWMQEPDAGIYPKWIGPTTNIIQDLGPADLGTTAKAAPIFWQFVNLLPGEMQTDFPGNQAIADQQKTYSDQLKYAIEKVINLAKKYDPIGFSSANTLKLDQTLYYYVAAAAAVVGLNKSDLTISKLPDPTDTKMQPYVRAYDEAFKLAKKLNSGANPVISSNSSNTSFDGTQILTEMELAQVLSGGFIGYQSKPEDVDTVDKVKTSFNTMGYAKKFEEISAKLPFKKADRATTNNTEFEVLQFFIIGTTGAYGPKTIAGFKSAFEKSSIK